MVSLPISFNCNLENKSKDDKCCLKSESTAKLKYEHTIIVKMKMLHRVLREDNKAMPRSSFSS